MVLFFGNKKNVIFFVLFRYWKIECLRINKDIAG